LFGIREDSTIESFQGVKQVPGEVEWAVHFLYSSAADCMCVDHRRADIAVPEQLLNGANVVVRPQQMAGETVPKGVWPFEASF